MQQQIQIQAHPQQHIAAGSQVQQATIVVCGVGTNSAPAVATLVQAPSIQAGRAQPVVNICPSPNQQQIVKAIVASPSNQNILTQQLAVAQNNPQQQVSVVLTTPVTTMSANQVQLSQPQIVSIHQSTPQIIQSSPAVTQATNSIVQTLATQSLPQVVSVAQLATVGTVMTTGSAALQQSQVATLTTSALRAQRIVAPPGTLQEVVLHQRSGSQSPTVVSVSGLGQGLTQAQLQTAQLRLSMAGGQQVSGVVAKGISVGTVTSAGKPINTSQIQFYRQQPIRQQLKVLHPSAAQGGTTVLQQATGQPTLVSPAIIQGNIIQTGTVGQTVQVQSAGQKVSVATVTSSAGAGTTTQAGTIATVQVAPGQQRTQFIKQVGTKQMITRPVTEGEMQMMMKRQIISQQHKQQLMPQTQIFAPANLQVQQAGTSGQQIATLVKTSSGTVAATGMTLSQVKPGQLKTISNQSQVRQLQLQQQIIAAQRKSGKMTQITQVAGKAGQPTQLFVQGPKNLPAGTVTVQQIQQVIRHAQPASIATGGQIVLGKTSVGRVIPVSVSQQANQRQTIQVSY